ncbi:MAG: PASTA domain-containing protein, partial [Actinobacteria bacterium]|nr:PASTA domain-containing protein [Actinomycetota bacterium]
AVDVVRVKLLNGQLADVRIGHMEAAVSVPTTGVRCPGIDVKHEVDKPTVTPGDDFTYTIVITNPNDCVLSKLKIVEKPTLPAGVKLLVLSATPLGGNLAAGVISSTLEAALFPDIGPLGPGESKTIKVKVKIPADSLGGKLISLATADGVCPPEIQPPNDTDGPQPGIPGVTDIPVHGSAQVEGPTVGVCVVPNLKNMTYAQAKAALEAQGCTIGTVTDKPGNPADAGKIVDQGTPPTTSVPIGTPVDVTISGPVCTVPALAGKTPEQAKILLEEAGCKLGSVTTDTTGKPEDAGKITTQNPPAGDKVKRETVVDVRIAPPACNVPNLSGLTEEAAKAALEKAGCRLGDVKPGPDNPSQAGKIVEQGTPADTLVPAGTNVNVTIAGPVCPVPNIVGMSEAEAKAKVEGAGCVLVTTPQNTTNPSEVGKVTTQNPGADTFVAKGSTVNATVGVQVLGAQVTRTQTTTSPNTDVSGTPTLVRTGGVALGGLALWLLISGLLTSAAGSERMWRLVRRKA